MAFVSKEVGGYTGKEIELFVKVAEDETSGYITGGALKQIRGAQNFNPTQEKGETKVNEMGFAAQKTIYGTVNYAVATTLMFRDLLQIARMGGIPNEAKILNVDKFKAVNAVNYIKDPDTKLVIATIFSLGYKARQSNKTHAVEANAQVVLDGSADVVVEAQGPAYVRQYAADGNNRCFIIDLTVGAGITAAHTLAVENPAGNLLDEVGPGWDGATFSPYVLSGDGQSCIAFDTSPENGTIVRIIYKTA